MLLETLKKEYSRRYLAQYSIVLFQKVRIFKTNKVHWWAIQIQTMQFRQWRVDQKIYNDADVQENALHHYQITKSGIVTACFVHEVSWTSSTVRRHPKTLLFTANSTERRILRYASHKRKLNTSQKVSSQLLF